MFGRVSPRSRPSGRRETRLGLEPLEARTLLDAGLAPQLLLTMHSGQRQTVRLDQGADVAAALAASRARSDVAAAEVDQQVSIAQLPNDPSFGSQWDLRNTGQSGGTADADIDADQAWDLGTGTASMAVGIIDTGIDYTHPDLYKNIWLNPGEVPTGLGLVDTDGDGRITFWDLNDPADAGKVNDANGNGRIDGYDVLHDSRWADGRDNDGDGKVDDLIGWDFVNNDNNPFDDNGHGTHVAGTIGAMGGNGVGVAGINWRVEMAGLKFLDSSGSGYLSAAIDALNYAVGKGIRITNNSWGGGGSSSALATAIANARAAGDLFVVAAGNSGTNNDTTATYPSNYNYDNIVAVASTDRYDRLSSFSNYGATTVDLAAPGSSILSTTPNNTYSTYSGTSMATPHVTGAAALVWSMAPSLTYSQVIARILNNVDPLVSLSGKVATGGRLNVYKAVAGLGPDTAGPRVVSAAANGTSSVSSVRLAFNEAINPSSFTTADISSFTGPTGAAITPAGVLAVSGSNNTQFDVTFAAQTAVGSYAMNIGPNITDAAGNLMDQNGNGTKGEVPGDMYHAAFAVSTTPTATTFTNATATAIRDFTTTVSTITVGQDLTIADLNVTLNIAHTWDSDLDIYLQAPNGTWVDLVRYRGGSGDNFTGTVLDDEASRSISSGAAPFTGAYRPEQALSSFDGRNARGTWTLYVYDRARYDTGTLKSWSLAFTPVTTAAKASSIAGALGLPAKGRPREDALDQLALLLAADRSHNHHRTVDHVMETAVGTSLPLRAV